MAHGRGWSDYTQEEYEKGYDAGYKRGLLEGLCYMGVVFTLGMIVLLLV